MAFTGQCNVATKRAAFSSVLMSQLSTELGYYVMPIYDDSHALRIDGVRPKIIREEATNPITEDQWNDDVQLAQAIAQDVTVKGLPLTKLYLATAAVEITDLTQPPTLKLSYLYAI